MSTIEYASTPAGPPWTREWEQGTIIDLARQAGAEIPSRPLTTRSPSGGDESEHYYACYSGVAGLDKFIYESCAGGLLLVDDPEFQLLLTRQIGDDGSHAQTYREVVTKGTGIDPIAAIDAESRVQRDIVGDLTRQGLAGFIAFEISYELYTAPEFLVLGRTARVCDSDLLIAGAERFGPDEFVHRQGIANWWHALLARLPAAQAAELTEEVRELDERVWQRRSADIERRWDVAERATEADYVLIRALRAPWRQEVHRFLFAS